MQPHEQTADYYGRNPLVYEERRRRLATSAWVRSFTCEDMRPLIVCRGPIRKEAMDVFGQMGMTSYGILLSEKDSIVYPNALAPELRMIEPSRVHRVPDYTGATREERQERIRQIIQIAHEHGYDSVFAGYGFMAEDESFVHAIEQAGLTFIGPCSHTVRAAGLKDEAKRTALQEKVSVTPGIDNATVRTLLAKHRDRQALSRLVQAEQLQVEPSLLQDESTPLEALADAVLAASYRKGIDLISVEEIGVQIQQDVTRLFTEHPGRRVRLKAIGGGGGKGQRILDGADAQGTGSLEQRAAQAAAVVPEKVREVLAEVKATGVGDNKNMLIELNVEQTRHHEIQLVGNGRWCISLGGRDCSLQMHEQKLLEISITQEALRDELGRARQAGAAEEAVSLTRDLEILERMEAEAERFGQAVALDSASTFECIVDYDRHFFMEVNTRIQVEHRVSELCYALRFANPEDPGDFFEVRSLVEMMALLAKHKERLPKPSRVLREKAAGEVRLNATDRSLSPHAGGSIRSWSDPLPFEIRDDQGICIKNPDTHLFMRYRLAGAYDSNIALLVTIGDSRQHTYDRLHEILRCSKLRGSDLATNLEFHYGLLNWFRTRHVYAKATTRFVVPYLTMVGLLKEEAGRLDLDFAYAQLQKHYDAQANPAASAEHAKKLLRSNAEIFARKKTLLKRVLDMLFAEPHFLSTWLSVFQQDFRYQGEEVQWLRNPIDVVADTYHLLNMGYRPGAPAAQVIWDHDHQLLMQAQAFYAVLRSRLAVEDYPSLARLLQSEAAPAGFSASEWRQSRAAHSGFQRGLEILSLLPLIARETRFFDLRVEPDLSITIPERLLDPALQARMRKVLVPPPATKADEIVAESGGMFYAREAPHLPPLVQDGDHFDAGQPLYIVEVMKMFNKIKAPFSGRIDKILIDNTDGSIIAKGQPLFKVTPDERIVEEDEVEKAKRRRQHTMGYLARVVG